MKKSLNKKSYDVLVIREYFPSKDNPSSSSWVLNQVISLIKEKIILPCVISPTPKVPPAFLNRFYNYKHHWKNSQNLFFSNYLGVNVYRPLFLKLPNKYFLHYNLKIISHVIRKTSKNLSFKLIHAHYGHAGIMSIKTRKKNNVPMIVSFYGYDLGSDRKRLEKKYKILAKEGNIFLTLSNDMASDLKDLGFPIDKIVVHHIGVDTDFFSFEKQEAKLEKIVFTVVSNFEERKGIQYVIIAFKKLIKQNPNLNTELRIVGDGYYKSKLLEIANNNSNIIFINNYLTNNPRKTVLKEIKNSNVFVLTSITMANGEKEGTPVVLLEAQSCGKPCIATNHAGIPEEVIDNYTGKIVPERNSEEILKQMLFFIKNPKTRIEMGINARNHILSEFNNSVQNFKLLQMYKEIIYE